MVTIHILLQYHGHLSRVTMATKIVTGYFFFSQFTFLEIYKGYSKSLKGMITTIVCATQVKRVIKIQLINIK